MKIAVICANGKEGKLIVKEVVAMVDEALNGNHIRQRISVVAE